MGKEFIVESLEDMCSLMCDNCLPRKKKEGGKKMKAVVKAITHNRVYGDNPSSAGFKQCALVEFLNGDEWELVKKNEGTTLVRNGKTRVLLSDELFDELFEVVE